MAEDPKPPDIEVTKTTTVSSGPQAHPPVDHTLLLIMGGTIFFAVMLLVSEIFFMADSQLFQVFAGLLTGFGGAFLAKVKGGDGK